MSIPVSLKGVIPSQGRYPTASLTSASPLHKLPYTSEEVLIPGCKDNPVSNQGGESSCVANAICDGLEISQIARGLPLVQLSRNALYYWSRCKHDAQLRDEGTYIPLALEQASIMGVIPEEAWPYVEERVNKAPTNDEILLASENQVGGFYEITGRGDEVAHQIAGVIHQGQPVVAAFWLGPEYRSIQPDQVAGVPGSRWGLHAQLIVGYRMSPPRMSLSGSYDFLVRNSWGAGWGDGGYIWASQDYVCDPRYVFDRYAFVTNKELAWP